MNPAASASETKETKIEITTATLADAQAIAELGSAVLRAEFSWAISPKDSAAYIEAYYTQSVWESELLDPSSTVYVARSTRGPTEILGFAQLKRGATDVCLSQIQQEGQLVKLDRIYVSSQVHGRGIGKALMDFLFEQARAEGFVNMWLGVWAKNSKAVRLYDRLGFRRVGDYDFTVGDEAQLGWILVKQLRHDAASRKSSS